MCGIAGIIHAADAPFLDTSSVLERMSAIMAHRGPDDHGSLRNQKVELVHRRLSIVDLSMSGHQPMVNETGDVWLVFNGEIYNHVQLRAELQSHKHCFVSLSDTEVLIHGYEQWGIEGLLRRIRGMFAFAIYDHRLPDVKVILARDRFGIKPLYYADSGNGGSTLFASEIRAIKASGLVESRDFLEGWASFLLLGSVPSPITIESHIKALQPGQYLIVSSRGSEVRSYYNLMELYEKPCHLDPNVRPSIVDPEAWKSTTRVLLDTSVRDHVVSDAPLGVFLSGGIDSSLLVSISSKLVSPLTTLGVTFDDERLSEDRFQHIVASRYSTDHRKVHVTSRDFIKEFPSFFKSMDQPTIDGLNTYFISKAARSCGLKAVLSGAGADEVFYGYDTFRRARWLAALKRVLGARVLSLLAGVLPGSKLRRSEFLSSSESIGSYLFQRGLFTPTETAELLGSYERDIARVLERIAHDPPIRDALLRQQYLETRYYLSEQLLKDADVFGMAHSVEIRVPFLDHALVEHAIASPSKVKLGTSRPKPLLSDAITSAMIPDEIVFRKKQGFTFPIDRWLRSDAFLGSGCGTLGDSGPGQKVWNEFRGGRGHWTKPWALIVLNNAKGYG